MLGWGHNSRGVETRHCRPHPQTRQTEEGARQLQTHLPDIPPRESVRTGDQEQTRILLWVQESVPRVPGRFPTGTGCHRPPGETGWARREGNREEKGPTDVLLWHLPCLRPGLACQAATETQQDRNFWQHVQLHQILPERQIDAGQVEGSHVDHQRSKYGRSSGICDRPLLFNIMVHDVDIAVKGKVVLTMNADDLAIWTDTHIRRLHTNSSWVKQSRKLFQEAVDGVVHFMQVNGFALSSQKTVFVPFHTNTSQNTEVHIRVNGQSIFASKEVKYLGVHFTRWGRTNQQVAHNARNTPKILVNVVRALVRSRLSYGLEAMPHLSKTGLARLTAIEVRGLRLALGLPQSVPQCLVYREAGLLPFRRHIQLVCSKYVFRCQTVDNSTVDEITATFRKPSRLQSYSSICDLVCDLVPSAGLDGVEVATRPMHPYPPWLLERAHVEVDMEGLKKDQNPLVLAVTARLCLEEKYQHHLKIFTDGSVMEDGAAGAAFVIPEFNNLTHSYSLPAVSVFTAELLAISMALQHISAIPVTPFAIVTCSDSKAALTAIKSDSQNAREDLVREIATTTHQLITRGTEVRFQWVPAHVCLSGNEKADRAAKRGAKGLDSSTVTMKIGLADVYAELTKQAWKQWEKEFHPMATAKEWDDTSPPCRAGVFFPGVPTYLARIMHRLHVGVWRCMCVPTKCECGMSVSFHHVMFSCTSCSDHFQPLTGKLRSVGLPLCTKSLAVCDQLEGWSLLRAAARLVYTCPLAAYL